MGIGMNALSVKGLAARAVASRSRLNEPKGPFCGLVARGVALSYAPSSQSLGVMGLGMPGIYPGNLGVGDASLERG